MGAIGAWLGVASGTVVLVSVMLSGMVLGLGLVVVRRRLGSVLTNLYTMVSGLCWALARRRLSEGRVLMPAVRQMETMPYGVAIFAGTCIAAGGTFVWHP
jgi:prepilin signal peptidase PulO-like enzyme (type II secretory pathway)